MKRLIAVTLALTLATLILTPTALAGKESCNPSYGLSFFAQNNTSTPVTIRVECDKGDFWANLVPGQNFNYGLSYDQPPNEFSEDWFAYGGDVVIYINNQVFVRRVKCLANLSTIEVVISPGKKEPKVKIYLTQ